jgi:16S rRNA (uracil1498-N3)-methyltransferase
MSERFFVDEPITGDEIVLTGAEAQHLLKVMRLPVGSQVVLFDGSGSEFRATVTKILRNEAVLRVESKQEANREAPGHVVIATALPKGDRQRWLVEKLTELGAHQLQPVQFERGVAEATDAALGRMRRTVIEASKQCGRNRLMEIAQPIDARELSSSLIEGAKLIADQRGKSWPTLAASITSRPRRVTIAIGPEGGLTEEEFELATRNSWLPVSFGPRILRIETACVAAAALSLSDV